MARRRAAEKRVVVPDSRFGSVTVSKFINCLMCCGKKSTAAAIVYDALAGVEEKLNVSGLDAFDTIMNNVRPALEVRSRRVGGATYQVPVEVNRRRSEAIAMRWLINCSKNRHERGMANQLTAEFMDAFTGRGASIKKRDDTHKMAEANRAFAHYRW